MEATIRAAQLADVDSIISVISASLGDEISNERIISILQGGQHITLVALVSERIVGFVDGFMTIAASGMPRAELDLLGVLPDMQGAGVGSKLVQEFVRLVSSKNPHLQIRALVAHQNDSMHRVMMRTGFSCDGGEYGLFIRDIDISGHAAGRAGHLIPVETLTYSGVWIEEHFTVETIAAANTLGLANMCEIVGSLIPLSDLDKPELAIMNGFSQIGTFRWWTRLP